MDAVPLAVIMQQTVRALHRVGSDLSKDISKEIELKEVLIRIDSGNSSRSSGDRIRAELASNKTGDKAGKVKKKTLSWADEASKSLESLEEV